MEKSSGNPDVRARIIAAAEELYEEHGTVPLVTDVRARAKCDMGICSKVFREWRLQQGAKPTPLAVEVPDPVKQAHIEAVAIIWTAAQGQANASLREAEAKWELERADNEEMRLQLSEAYDGARTDAEEARSTLDEVLRAKDSLTQQNQVLAQQLAEVREGLVQQTTRADENERRANDLKDELRNAHEETAGVRQELSQARLTHLAELDQQKAVAAEQIERLNEKLASTKARLEAANEQSEIRAAALSDTQAKLAQAQAQADTASDELQRVRVALEDKQQQAEGLQQQAATLGAQLTELQRSHAALQGDAEKSRQVADESSRELAKVSGVLEAVQAQKAELMSLMAPKSARPSKKSE
ncbi:Chromosome partition protein Smc [compost metagenome]